MKIEIINLTKKYGEATVLNNISLTFTGGTIYGLVGRNGSGKTMLLKHILGFVHPTSGRVQVDGKEIGKDIDMPENAGAIIETPGFLPEYTGFKNLKMLALIRGKASNEDIKKAIHLVGLDPDSKKKVGAYSLGMRQRLGLAQALMENPEILLLDEPLSGLDNEGVDEMHQLLLQMKQEGKLVIIASHNKEDVDILCDEVISFDKGNLMSHEILEK